MEVVAGGTGSHPTETYLSVRLRKLPCIYIAWLAVISARSVCTLLFLYAILPMLCTHRCSLLPFYAFRSLACLFRSTAFFVSFSRRVILSSLWRNDVTINARDSFSAAVCKWRRLDARETSRFTLIVSRIPFFNYEMRE